MRGRSWLAPLVLVVASAAVAFVPSRPTIGERTREKYVAGLDSLAGALDDLRLAGVDQLARARQRSRLAYKSVEWLLEYFDGMAASTLNGRENEQGDGDADEGAPAPEPLSGFAGIDAAVAEGGGGAIDVADVRRRALLMARTVRAARSNAKHIEMDERGLFDAARLELVRVATLGLGGFDAAEPRDRAREAAAALRGLRDGLAFALDATTQRRETNARLTTAIGRLDASDADNLDVFSIIADALYPAARALNAERRRRGVELPPPSGAWRASSDFVFDRDALDPLAFAKGNAADTGRAVAALGETLFFDPMLSGDGSRTCASCHRPERAFTEDRPRTETFDTVGQSSARNTPTLINAGFEPALFADLRVRTLEDQIAVVVASRTEMRGSLEAAAKALSKNEARRRAFEKAFQSATGSPVVPRQIQAALAAYIRSLNATDSRFDRAIRGEPSAFSASERRGFNVFMGKARCGTCHFAPLFNGTMPPDYWATPPEVIGVPASRDRAVIDPDLGRGGVDGQPGHRFAFKTPTLRNVALTSPYMHNGVFRTLEEVVEFYDGGGGAGRGIDVPNQTLRRDKLGLTADERSDIVAFLGSLTDTVVGPRRQR